MPNIVAHNHLAFTYKHDPAPDFLLGSVLPDFVGMYRDYHGETVPIRDIGRNLNRGINFHYASDRIFDSQPEKPQMTRELTKELSGRDIKPRAARLGAHLLADIMLDGALLNRYEARTDYETLKEYVEEEETTLHGRKFPDKFTEMVCGYFERDIPWKYQNPEELAVITKRRLDFRAVRNGGGSDSMISEHQLPVLAEVIEQKTNLIRFLGTTALDRTIETLDEMQSGHRLLRFFRTP